MMSCISYELWTFSIVLVKSCYCLTIPSLIIIIREFYSFLSHQPSVVLFYDETPSQISIYLFSITVTVHVLIWFVVSKFYEKAAKLLAFFISFLTKVLFVREFPQIAQNTCTCGLGCKLLFLSKLLLSLIRFTCLTTNNTLIAFSFSFKTGL